MMFKSEYDKRMNQMIEFEKTGQKVIFTEEEKKNNEETLTKLIKEAKLKNDEASTL